MIAERIKLVVINENTLGYLIPGIDWAGVLHASVLKGSKFNNYSHAYIKDEKVRLASEKDFEEFRVSFKGYENPDEYEYAEAQVDGTVYSQKKAVVGIC
jgi:hypothetical protein